jgi:hypothetical protein
MTFASYVRAQVVFLFGAAAAASLGVAGCTGDPIRPAPGEPAGSTAEAAARSRTAGVDVDVDVGVIRAALTTSAPPPHAPSGSFTTFESGQVRPLALSPDRRFLYAVNTPDGQWPRSPGAPLRRTTRSRGP